MNIDNNSATLSMPIAIVGIGMRFPANARTEAEMWKILNDAHCEIGEIPSSRWPVKDLSHPDRSEPGRSVTFRAGVIDKIDEFDPAFFGISPREAAWMDPQQRMLLEMAHDAMEDADIPPESLAGTPCGVYVGISGMDYGQNALTDLASMSPWTMTGNTLSIAANRISWVYNLQGPSLAIDTACSSSLAAIHQACQALRDGEIPIALAGGVNVLMHPYAFIGFSHASMLSAKGECRPFDAAASGYVRGEGGALFLLKPLEQAIKNGDNIHAVILGSGINSDGSRKSGLTIPSVAAQTELMEGVLAKSGIAPEDLDFVEAHGTGTPVGDPVEATSIGQAYGKKRSSPLPISSAKANFGHLEPASGAAGMVKAILTLKHGRLPPMPLNFTPNPAIPFSELNIFCPSEGHDLKEQPGKPLMGAVNSFGFGGLNAHIILSRGPEAAPRKAGDLTFPALFLSARTDAALRQIAEQYANLLKGASQESYDAIIRAAALNRGMLEKRLAILARQPEQAVCALRDFADGHSTPDAATVSALPEAGGLAFIYSGNGSQWAGMGKQLMAESEEFRQSMEMLDRECLPILGWSILKALQEADDEFMEDTAHAQPLLFAMQAALTLLLEKMGLKPDAAIGHSVGEIAAAWAAGQLALPEAIRIVNARSLAQGRTKGMGKMAAIGLGEEKTRALIDEAGLAGQLEIAANNSPLNCTVSGNEEAIDILGELCAKKGIFFRKLNLDYAFHSKAMNQEAEALEAMLADLQPKDGEDALFISTVDAKKMRGSELDGQYWWRNMRQSVEFARAIEILYKSGMRIFLEVGPHAVLQRYIRENQAENAAACRVLPLMQRETAGFSRIRQIAAQIHLLLGRKSLRKLFGEAAPHVSLPLYQWQRERHSFPRTSERLPQPDRKWPLLGWPLPSTDPLWENILDPRKDAWLNDHRIAGSTVLAAAAWMELALEAGQAWLGHERIGLEKLAIELPLLFENDQPQTLRTTINPQDGSFRILSRPRLVSCQWTEHARGRIISLPPDSPAPKAITFPDKTQRINHEDFYSLTRSLELEYGTFFKRIASLQFDGQELEAALSDSGNDDFALNPGAIDACFHSLAALYSQTGAANAFLPVGVEKTALYSPEKVIRLQGKLRKISRRTLLADFLLLDAEGQTVAALKGCKFRQLPASGSQSPVSVWKTESSFAPLPRDSAPACTGNVQDYLRVALEKLNFHKEERTLWHREVLQNIEAMAAIGMAGLYRQFGRELSERLPVPLATWLKNLLPEDRDEVEENYPDWQELWKEIRKLAPEWLTASLPLARLLYRLPELASGRQNLEALSAELQAGPEALSGGYAQPAWLGMEIILSGLAQAIAGALPPTQQLHIQDYGPWPSLLEHELAEQGADKRISFQSSRTLDTVTKQPDEREDIIISRNMLHSASNLAVELENIFSRLQPGGLFILEERNPDWSVTLLEGLKESWWRAGTDAEPLPARMGPEEWRAVLEACGFKNITIQLEPASEGMPQGVFLVIAQKPCATANKASSGKQAETGQSWLLLEDKGCQTFSEQLAHELDQRGQKTIRASLNGNANFTADNIAILPNPDNTETAPLLEKIRNIGLEKQQGKIWLLTRGGSLLAGLPESYETRPLQAALTGFARVFNNESNSGIIYAIDLDLTFSTQEAVQIIMEEFFADANHEEISWTSSGRFEPIISPQGSSRTMAAERCRLDIPAPGKLDRLQWQALEEVEPGEEEIEARVMATGLNFRDIMLSLGLLPEDALENGFAGAAAGLEFAGIVTRAGSRVKDLAPGDRIAGFAPSSFSSHVRTPAKACAKIPDGMSFQEAASLPTIFVTAWYALHYLGHIQAGESILIHGGAGGVGLAAIQIAQQAGAKVFATAGTNEKRDLLRLLGVELVMDSRSLNFADQILDATNGEGVDLVLNSLAGEAMRRSLRLLKPFGRFLELGKRDYVENTSIGLAPFKENISYFGIDVDQLQSGRPDLANSLFSEVMEFLKTRALLPPPITIFRADKIIPAFRAMQQSRHIGKIVVDMSRLPKISLPDNQNKITDLSGTWLVSGGLSGFGLATAKHLAELGVKNLALVSRHGKTAEGYPAIRDYFENLGVNLFVEACDVSDPRQVEKLIKKLEEEMPPLKGLVHAAAIFDDRLLADMDKDTFERVLRPKLKGALNLHEATRRLPLEYFILYSSISVPLGNPGQANYVAANAGLEALARMRIAMKLPASCIAWGPIGDCGYLGRNPKVREVLEKRIGARTLTSAEAMKQFDRFAATNGIHIVGNADWSKAGQQGGRMPARLAHLAGDQNSFTMPSSGWLEQIRLMPRHEALNKLSSCIISETAKVLGLQASDVPEDKSLPSLGLDSLMAMELATGIQQATGLRLPAMLMQDAPSIAQLSGRLYSRMMGSQTDEAESAAILAELARKHAEDLAPEETQDVLNALKDGKK